MEGVIKSNLLYYENNVPSYLHLDSAQYMFLTANCWLNFDKGIFLKWSGSLILTVNRISDQ